MKNPMVDKAHEHMGGMKAAKADAKSGLGHAPPNAKKSAGGGVSSGNHPAGRTGGAVGFLNGMKK